MHFAAFPIFVDNPVFGRIVGSYKFAYYEFIPLSHCEQQTAISLLASKGNPDLYPIRNII
jgi:hypothetical protein